MEGTGLSDRSAECQRGFRVDELMNVGESLGELPLMGPKLVSPLGGNVGIWHGQVQGKQTGIKKVKGLLHKEELCNW